VFFTELISYQDGSADSNEGELESIQNQMDSISAELESLATGCLQDTSWWVGYIEPNCSGWGGLIELYPPLARYITVESSCYGWGGGTLRIYLPDSTPCNGYVITVISPEGLPDIDVEGESVPGNQDVDYAADFIFFNGKWYRK
jgi:hypothetical protein